MDQAYGENLKKVTFEFLDFTDKYVDSRMMCDHPALWYMLNHLKAAAKGPEQLEFPFLEPAGSKK